MDKTEVKWGDYSLIGIESDKTVEMGLADAEWYQSPIPREKMRELLERKNGPAIRDTLLWFGLILCSAYLVYLFWGSWFVVFPYIVYSVLYASTSDSRWHESSHGTAFKSDWMNNILYEISSFMVLRQSTVWRWSHARHHSDTIIRGRDPEIAVPRPPDIKKLVLVFFGISSAVPEFKKIVRHSIGRIDPQVATYVPPQDHKIVFFKARIYILIFLTVIVLSVVFKSILPLMYIGLPTLLGSWLMPVYGLTQHAGLQENVLDHRLNCRTVYMNRVHRFLYWNMNYHVEHHMFPLVPYHALPKLHELMKDDCPKPYNGIVETFKEIIPAILKQRKNPSYFVERKLPEKKPTELTTRHTFFGKEKNLKDGIIEVCNLGELPKGEIIRFDFQEKTYAIYHTKNGTLYATEGNCSHGNAHLADGVIINDLIECPKHNGRFSLENGSPKRTPVCVGIHTYKVLSENGKIYLNTKPSNQRESQDILSYKVVSNNNVATFIKELVLEPENDALLNFKPGQYAQFLIPPHETKLNSIQVRQPFNETWNKMRIFDIIAKNSLNLKRNYSMASNPITKKQLTVTVRLALPPKGEELPAGAGSSYVFALKTGDSIQLTGPFGDFFIKQTDKEMVYIGGGAGMAPIRSHLSYLFETEKTKRKISFWYGARTLNDLYYSDYFDKIQKTADNFTFYPALSEAEKSDIWNGLTGNIHEVVSNEYLKSHENIHAIEFYLCGPPPMIKASLSMLKQLGVKANNIAFDEF